MKKILIVTVFVCIFVCSVTPVFAAGNVAKIGDTQYATLSEAITSAGTSQATITLIDNVNLTGKISFPKGSNIVLDLNGKNLNVPTVENNYGIVVGGDLQIKGSGTVSLGMYGIGVQPTGNLVIESGTYKCLSGDYLLGSWGKATIKGGLFDGNYCIANGFDGGTVEILDGTFYTKEPTIVLGATTIYSGAFNQDVSDYLADGIEMKLYNGVYFTGKVYKIVLNDVKNGSVDVVKEAIAEQPVKIVAKANTGYEIGSIKVVDANGKTVDVSDSEFVMPNSDVTVSVTFSKMAMDDTPATGGMDFTLLISVILLLVSLALIFTKKKVLNK